MTGATILGATGGTLAESRTIFLASLLNIHVSSSTHVIGLGTVVEKFFVW
jgi:hypothetical protein